MPCIAVSTLYVLLTMFIAEALRKIVEAVMPDKSLAKTAILEFVAAAEMCGCGFELIISKILYGVGVLMSKMSVGRVFLQMSLLLVG